MKLLKPWWIAVASVAIVLGAWSVSRAEGTDDHGPEHPNVGDPAPAFALASASCETVALEDYAGQPVAVVFYRGQW